MTTEAYHRKLTTILYTDVAGYSRHTGGDEEGTHRRVMEILDFASARISEGGKVLRYAGDAILAEFSSTVTAARTALDIQQALARENRGLDDDKKVQIRIGINIGDVIEDRGEVFGDGVNLAARLEAAAPEGGICISASVHEQVRGKLDARFSDDGEQEFKNINHPVRVYKWEPSPDADHPPAAVRAPQASEKPSIAVLALTNMNRDPDLDYIGDGITEDLITALSRIRSFKVISRESTFSYKGTAIDVRKVATELGVRFVLEGSVRKAGNRVRVTAQLIDAATGHHVWAERYDREMEDIFALQDEMVEIIAAALEPELNAFERERAHSKPPDNLDAWEMYQRALWHMWTYEEEHGKTAMKLFKQASEADPKFAPAYAYYAYCCYQSVIMGYADDPDARLEEGMESARRALKCDDRDAIPYFALGRILMMQGDHDGSIAALRKSIELNPSFAQAYHGLGFALSLAGELEEADRTTQKAVAMSPRDPMLWAFTVVHALNLLLMEDYDAALDWAQRTLQIPTETGYWAHAVKAAALGRLGRVEEGRQSLALALEAKPNLSIPYLETNLPTRQSDGLKPYLEGLKACGLQ